MKCDVGVCDCGAEFLLSTANSFYDDQDTKQYVCPECGKTTWRTDYSEELLIEMEKAENENI